MTDRPNPIAARDIFLCDKPGCGRSVYKSNIDEFRDWLIGEDVKGKLIVRCPTHMTDHQLRRAQYPRRRGAPKKWVQDWRRQARENDKQRTLAGLTAGVAFPSPLDFTLEEWERLFRQPKQRFRSPTLEREAARRKQLRQQSRLAWEKRKLAKLEQEQAEGPLE